ncbi:MAG TPA: class I SAM-dependent methyltransferase [Candidatus Limnocylindrales bacterium]|nr:class I SAM-dependent methyltransferase [Candidatus Limnocylindrales bacterium]
MGNKNKGSIAYFDQVAADYFQRYYENSPGGYALRVRQEKVLELLDKPTGKLLDVGCGPGVMVPKLINLGFEFWGVDASPRMIEQCHKAFGKVNRAHFTVGNATALAFADEFFDVILCMGVIDRIKDYETAIQEMSRVLKPGGTLLITFTNLLSPHAAWRNFVFYPMMACLRPLYYGLTRRPQPPALVSLARLYTQNAATRLVTKYCGRVTDVVYFYINLFLSPLDELFPRWAVWTAERLEPLCSGKLKWLGASFIVKAKKRSHFHATS